MPTTTNFGWPYPSIGDNPWTLNTAVVAIDAEVATRLKVQATTPGTQQIGHANISGVGIFGTRILSPNLLVSNPTNTPNTSVTIVQTDAANTAPVVTVYSADADLDGGSILQSWGDAGAGGAHTILWSSDSDRQGRLVTGTLYLNKDLLVQKKASVWDALAVGFATLYPAGMTAGGAALAVGNPNGYGLRLSSGGGASLSTGADAQITFGQLGGYAHSIRTRHADDGAHNAALRPNNAIDVFLWDPVADTAPGPAGGGSYHVFTLNALGRVGINESLPTATLDVKPRPGTIVDPLALWGGGGSTYLGGFKEIGNGRLQLYVRYNASDGPGILLKGTGGVSPDNPAIELQRESDNSTWFAVGGVDYSGYPAMGHLSIGGRPYPGARIRLTNSWGYDAGQNFVLFDDSTVKPGNGGGSEYFQAIALLTRVDTSARSGAMTQVIGLNVSLQKTGASGVTTAQAIYTAPISWASNAYGLYSDLAAAQIGQAIKANGSQSADLWQLLKSDNSVLIRATGAGNLQTGGYTSGVSGWQISQAGNAEFNDLLARGTFQASVFVFGEKHVVAGTQVIAQAASVVSTGSSFTTPGSFTHDVTTISGNVDAASDGSNGMWAVNDRVQMRTFVGNAIKEIRGRVTAVGAVAGGVHSLTIALWTGTSVATTFVPGTPVINYGQSGAGFITLSSDGQVGSSANISWITHAGDPFTGQTLEGRAGNLNGSYDYASAVYGWGFGRYGVAGKAWLTNDPTNGIRIGSNTSVVFKADPSGNLSLTGNLTIGTAGSLSSGQTAWNTGTGYWFEYNGGTPRFSIGSSATNKGVTWDGTTLNINAATIADVLSIGTSGEIRQGTGTLGSNFTGLRVWRTAGVGQIGGYNANTLQWYADTDGKLYAGGGNVQVSAVGVLFKSNVSLLAWTDGSLKWHSYIANDPGIGVSGVNNFRIDSNFDAASGGTNTPVLATGRITLRAFSTGAGNNRAAFLYVQSDGTDGWQTLSQQGGLAYRGLLIKASALTGDKPTSGYLLDVQGDVNSSGWVNAASGFKINGTSLLATANTWTAIQTVENETRFRNNGSVTAYGRTAQYIDGALHLTANVRFDGSNWQADTTGSASYLLTINTSNIFARYATGSNPRTLSTLWNSSASGFRIGDGTAAGQLLEVVGGKTALYGNSATNVLALGYSASAGVAWLGASNSATPDIYLLNNSLQQIAAFTNARDSVVAVASLGTGATSGFTFIAALAGAPSGTPTNYASGTLTPITYDKTNKKLYVYDFPTSSWKGVTVT